MYVNNTFLAFIESAKSNGSSPRNILLSYCAHNSYTIPLLTRHCEWSKEGGLSERATVTFIVKFTEIDTGVVIVRDSSTK